jgi:hypothetical protein
MPIQRITSGILADGAIVAADIADGIVTNAKLAGSITSDKITSVSNTAIAGLIQSAQIGSVSNTAIAGLIQSAQIGSANASVINAGTLAGARLPAGSVLQVLQGIFNSGGAASTTSTTFVQFPNLALSVTPTSASNKILVLMSTAFFGPVGNTMFITIARGSTNLGATNGFAQKNESGWTNTTMVYLDSPNTTSSVTYNLYARVSGGTGYVYGDAGMTNTVTLLEIAA